MIALPQRAKRPRSPSPTFEPDIASPLDVLLKRRRRDTHQQQPFGFPEIPHSTQSPVHGYEPDYFQQGGNGVPYTPNSGESPHGVYGQQHALNAHAESSSAAQLRAAGLNQAGVGIGVERRRTKQWNRINAPMPLQQHQATQQPVNALTTPTTHAGVYQTQPTSAFLFPTPPPPSRIVSTREAPLMSSSPIRNQPPSSSPFRDRPNNDDLVAPDEMGEPMDEEEMVRNWGEAYAEQNSILHSLHMTRMKFPPHASPQSHPSYSSHSSSNPWRTPMASSSTLFSPGPSRFAQEAAGQVSPHPYRTPYQSSPFTPARPSGNHISYMYPTSSNQPPSDIPSSSERHQFRGEDDDMGEMEAEAEIVVESDAEREVANRYEEANKLLGELAMVRRQRWGQEE
ncbi:hypothetical protein I350_08049 [Cryptococcus amylolentus CBS 6273]|uniref:Uncharacterized protein n=1 Tax=Cryptococcus amylolentus CBS 6273 TaxID=1296118 RepID=A0A1E3J875_9TREE|nr:hypothetical protein I350_08049 [Cryptococcus amylolentus CBS 6273]